MGESEPVPKVRPTRRHFKDSPATPFHNWYDAVAFSGRVITQHHRNPTVAERGSVILPRVAARVGLAGRRGARALPSLTWSRQAGWLQPQPAAELQD